MTIGRKACGIAATILLAVFASTSVQAGTAVINAKVNRVLVNGDGTFGGCMALLSVNPQSVLPACGTNWVTFSCSGDFTDPVRAYWMLDQAQLALATDKTVMVVLDDSRRHNGYCFAQRIDVAK